MDFELTPEQREFQRAVRDVARDVVALAAAGYDEREEFPLEVVRKLASSDCSGCRSRRRTAASTEIC